MYPNMLEMRAVRKYLPPATKLGQGYIFTDVCHSVNRGVPGPVGWLVENPLPPRQLLLRAVRILLECILVVQLVMQASISYAQSKHTHQNTIQIMAYHHPGEQERVQPSVPLRAHELKVIKAKAKSYCSLFRGMTRYDPCYQQNTKQ